jgi:RNA polymerase sigma factor (sigma-70 family)
MQGNAALPDWLHLLLPSSTVDPPILLPSANRRATVNAAGENSNVTSSSKTGTHKSRGRDASATEAVPASAPARERAPRAGMTVDGARTNEDQNLLAHVDRIAGGDETALANLYDATVSRVYGVALRIVRQPESAEEVVTDVYMQVWKDAVRYDATRGRVMAWLLIMARTRSLDLLRRADEAFSHPEPHELVDDVEERLTPQDLIQASADHTSLHTALLALTPMQRQLLALAFFKGLSHSEIVEHTGMPLGSVKTHIRRGLAELRKALESHPTFTR